MAILMQSSFWLRRSPKSIQFDFFGVSSITRVFLEVKFFVLANFDFLAPGEQLKDSPRGQQNGHFDV